MFTRIKSSPTTKKKYLQICKGTYVNGRTSHKVIGSLGAIDDLIESGEMNKLLGSLNKLVNQYGANGPIINLLPTAIKELKRLQWGATKVIQALWKIFEIDDFLAKQNIKVSFDFRSAFMLLVLDRFVNPRSKLQTFQKSDNYWGIDAGLGLQHIYRSLDILAKLKPSLEKHLFDINRNLFNMKIDIVFFDATTLYFQSDKADDLRKFGFSKDCKFNDVQIVLGLLMDQDGRPVGFEVFPGNTFDGKTLIKSLEALKKNFEIEKLILVGDRGICSKVNLEAIREAGYEYIVATSLRKRSKNIQEQVLDKEGYKSINDNDSEIFKFKEIELNNERLIVSWSSKRARKDACDREKLIEKAQEVVDGISKLKKPGKAKYLKIKEEIRDLDGERILADERWDGYYGILSSNQTMTSKEIYSAYRQLWRIEDCFRVLKSHLKIRPIFHWNPKRIEGHLTLCFLTFVFERHLEIELRKNQITELGPQKIREAVNEMQASLVEINQREYLLRSQISDFGKTILKIFGIRVPQEMSLLKDF